ncbi:low molecular weight protein-tyrosine-phosphatase [Candidatus Nitrosacidococcus sp. I8]|uniref:low molecular weight protein-tyrosine-phosphatase n=1 Tax=Candidatus Nitrosacidococcus sp. I8 TaxID=2942908 RepID=UPI0022280393|nr:low molecular weight protein-tyrosine-phosphatase [Candidatus Nitrosacidococcus sp. I8]CAH9019287.1 Low molecular weight protein-tyrosine-phosphatase YfkJ [Candidatus Nitrosacidococcus sp. I8]
MAIGNWVKHRKSSTRATSSEHRVNVLFVCTANVCRSPMAEGIFKQLVAQHNLSHFIFTDSAGTSSGLGIPPDPRARVCCQNNGISIDHSRSRQIQKLDYSSFDYIIAMDKKNKILLQKSALDKNILNKIHLFLDFSHDFNNKGKDIPDPYYSPAKEFENIFNLIEEASVGLLQEICRQHNYIAA